MFEIKDRGNIAGCGYPWVVVCAVVAAVVIAWCSETGNASQHLNASRKITLITYGESEYLIIVPDGEDPRNRVGRAANLLQSIVAEATGVKLSIIKEAKAPQGKLKISLGKTRAAQVAGIKVNSLTQWTFVKRVAGKDIYLVGNDVSANIKDRPEYEYLGTLKAVISFLEDEVGVRFLLPGPNGMYVPKLSALEVNSRLNVTVAPQINISGPWNSKLYEIANNYIPLFHFKTYGGHSYYKAVPLAKYEETHPEYFILMNGKRVPKWGESPCEQNHLCISNPAVQELILKEMEKQFDLGYEWVQLCQTDCYRACECDKCKVIAGGDAGEALWIVHRKLAEEIKKRRPGKKVVVVAYEPTADPPKSFDRFPDNVVIELCNYTPEYFEKWKRFHTEKLVYVYNWGTYHALGFLPKRSPEYLVEQIKLFAAHNVRSIYRCGFGDNLGLEGPLYYLYGKLLMNPDANPRQILNNYFLAAYDKAVAPMKGFFNEMYKHLELNSHIPQWNDPKLHWSQKDMLPMTPEARVTCFFPPELILSMEYNLNEAMTIENDPPMQARLYLVKREFEYLKNVVAIFTYYRAYCLSTSLEMLDLLESELNKRGTLIDSWYDATGQSKNIDGWFMFAQSEGFAVKKEFLKQGGIMTGTLSNYPPFSWNKIKLLEEKLKASKGRTTP